MALFSCLLVLHLPVAILAQDPPPAPAPAPPTNILPSFNPHMQKCNDAVLDARGRPCLLSALSASPALTQAYAEALRDSTTTKLDAYAAQVYKITQDQCTSTCFQEYKQSAQQVLAACGTKAFGGDERFDIVGKQVATAVLVAHQWVWGHKAMCLRSPSSGYPCAYDLARDNGTLVPHALEWAALDKLTDRAAVHGRTGAWIKGAVPGRATCGGCMLGMAQLRMVANRVIGDSLDTWDREKGVGSLDNGDGTRPRRELDESNDQAFVTLVGDVCKDTSPLKLNAMAKSVADVQGMSVDEASGTASVQAVYLYDTPGLGAGAIVGIVFGVLAAVGAGVAGYFYWYKQRTGRVPVTFDEVKEMVRDRIGAKKFR
ncbi:hypothetical protein BCR44DRAFT_33846 [Catenaria anguillulae PL171]|uniref:Uncharacterized protein n=1 Tax=Catenaria anguillulae PL171 TaxID=765915 RepID=A0A1Y2HQC6_9FUNG|nr:hypothetical protein BCR44DRAFT_33846 [Catenaria anguillulae PL171]